MAATAQDPHAPLRGGGDKAKDEDIEDVEYSPFYGIEKGAVLQEARIFHGPNLDPRRCQQVITKLLYLLNQGETFTKKEASEVFFAATKLFQNKDMNLRRMVYLCLKDICPGSDEVIIVTSSLMKDMNSTVDLYRSNSIRVLRSIIDSQLLVQIERYFKQAIVDKEPVVASAALVAGLHLLKNNGEVVKRWSEEIQAAVSNKSPMVQFHAIALLASIKATDRLAISKLVSSLTHGSTKSPLATCLLIKYITKVLKDTVPNADGSPRPFYDFLQSSLRHKSEMVMFQAARAIAEMKEVTMRELAPAITVLQLFLSSSKPVLRFTAVRTLNKVSMTHPMAVASCNIEMEHLMTDTNRSIATYAITTLLKTGSESSVERLLKQIGTFMSDIADDFKIVVVEAIRALCEKFPAKHRILMNFLAHTLREEGGFEYKKAIVDAILSLINNIEAAKESGLLHLSEFIEDCEFTYLATQVLHVLGTEGPKSSDPSKYIRFIYNRIILENATVRAAAVSALAAFGAQVDSLQERIVMLLKRTLQDNDDEVRDRSTLYIKQLTSGPQPSGTDVILHKFDVPLVNLEKALNEYLAGPMDTDFSLDAVDREVEEPTVPVKKGKKVESLVPQKVVPTEAEEFGKQVEQMPQFAGLGPRFKSCKAVPLTEEDTEYVVVCIKHIYTQHVLLQFNCTNTIAEQVLENVSMEVDLSGLEDVEVAEDLTLPLKRMPHNAPGSSYLVIEREEDSMPSGSAMAVMKFTVKEVDPATGTVEEDGYEDEYQLEDLNFNSSDYIKAKPVSNFKSTWDELDPDTEVADDYGLGVVEGITGTVESIMEHLGMACCEGTDVVAANARSHTIMLSGEFCGGTAVLARILFGLDSKNELAMKVVTRGDSLEASKLLHSVIQEA